jgi:hypothetical protein
MKQPVYYLWVHHAYKRPPRSVKHKCALQQPILVLKQMEKLALQVPNAHLAYASLHFAF